ncbi:MAG: hypothetical protein HY006_00380 [Candidatus Sungbacteria bacterium]|nr:hypothetical protein [Candidatus Sungbacteria bacterium]
MVVLFLMTLLLGLFYVLEINVIIRDSSRIHVIKNHLRDLALQSQSLAAHSALRLNTQVVEEIKGRFSLTEAKVLTYIEPKPAQFSLKEYPHLNRSLEQGNHYE